MGMLVALSVLLLPPLALLSPTGARPSNMPTGDRRCACRWAGLLPDALAGSALASCSWVGRPATPSCCRPCCGWWIATLASVSCPSASPPPLGTTSAPPSPSPAGPSVPSPRAGRAGAGGACCGVPPLPCRCGAHSTGVVGAGTAPALLGVAVSGARVGEAGTASPGVPGYCCPSPSSHHSSAPSLSSSSCGATPSPPPRLASAGGAWTGGCAASCAKAAGVRPSVVTAVSQARRAAAGDSAAGRQEGGGGRRASEKRLRAPGGPSPVTLPTSPPVHQQAVLKQAAAPMAARSRAASLRNATRCRGVSPAGPGAPTSHSCPCCRPHTASTCTQHSKGVGGWVEVTAGWCQQQTKDDSGGCQHSTQQHPQEHCGTWVWHPRLPAAGVRCCWRPQHAAGWTPGGRAHPWPRQQRRHCSHQR